MCITKSLWTHTHTHKITKSLLRLFFAVGAIGHDMINSVAQPAGGHMNNGDDRIVTGLQLDIVHEDDKDGDIDNTQQLKGQGMKNVV